jgi:hypothetical protein
MWIKFTSAHKFAVRVWVGGVNAVSGESKNSALLEPGLTQYIPLSSNESNEDEEGDGEDLDIDGDVLMGETATKDSKKLKIQGSRNPPDQVPRLHRPSPTAMA